MSNYNIKSLQNCSILKINIPVLIKQFVTKYYTKSSSVIDTKTWENYNIKIYKTAKNSIHLSIKINQIDLC